MARRAVVDYENLSYEAAAYADRTKHSLRQWREQENLTEEEVGEFVGVPPQSVKAIEAGRIYDVPTEHIANIYFGTGLFHLEPTLIPAVSATQGREQLKNWRKAWSTEYTNKMFALYQQSGHLVAEKFKDVLLPDAIASTDIAANTIVPAGDVSDDASPTETDASPTETEATDAIVPEPDTSPGSTLVVDSQSSRDEYVAQVTAVCRWLDEHGFANPRKSGTARYRMFRDYIGMTDSEFRHVFNADMAMKTEYMAIMFAITNLPELDPRRRGQSRRADRQAWTEEQWQQFRKELPRKRPGLLEKFTPTPGISSLPTINNPPITPHVLGGEWDEEKFDQALSTFVVEVADYLWMVAKAKRIPIRQIMRELDIPPVTAQIASPGGVKSRARTSAEYYAKLYYAGIVPADPRRLPPKRFISFGQIIFQRQAMSDEQLRRKIETFRRLMPHMENRYLLPDTQTQPLPNNDAVGDSSLEAEPTTPEVAVTTPSQPSVLRQGTMDDMFTALLARVVEPLVTEIQQLRQDLAIQQTQRGQSMEDNPMTRLTVVPSTKDGSTLSKQAGPIEQRGQELLVYISRVRELLQWFKSHPDHSVRSRLKQFDIENNNPLFELGLLIQTLSAEDETDRESAIKLERTFGG